MPVTCLHVAPGDVCLELHHKAEQLLLPTAGMVDSEQGKLSSSGHALLNARCAHLLNSSSLLAMLAKRLKVLGGMPRCRRAQGAVLSLNPLTHETRAS